MSKPEARCLKEMALEILKSKTFFVNQIAASLRESLKLKDVAKRLPSQHLKNYFASKLPHKDVEYQVSELVKKIQSLHFNLLLDAGYNYLNKHTVRELTNFIYYKISKVVSILLMPTKIGGKYKVSHLKSTPHNLV